MKPILDILRKLKLYTDRIYNNWVIKTTGIQIEGEITINGRIYIQNKGKIIIKNNTIINSGLNYSPTGGHTKSRIITEPGAILIIGENVGITNSTIYCSNNIEIGDNTLIGGSCNIWDTDFHSTDYLERRKIEDRGKSYPIKIGHDVFIGGQCIILKGSILGDKSIITAGTMGRVKTEENEIFKR